MAVRDVPTTSQRRPLLVTDDQLLLDECVRIADYCGVDLDVAPDPPAARSRYLSAPLVLIGLEAATDCVRARLPLRDGVVLVGVDESGPGDPPGRQLVDATSRAVDPPWRPTDPPWRLADALGVEQVCRLPTGEHWLVERLGSAVGASPGAVGRVVAVLGGRGGAGASVLAAGLAVTAARSGHRVLLVDNDQLSGGIDLVLGWEDSDGLRWPALAETSGVVSAPALIQALPRRGDLAVVSWDRGQLIGLPETSMAATLDAGRRGHDLVVVDLPRSLDRAAQVALEAADRVFIVVPAELRASAAAARVAQSACRYTGNLEVIVREQTGVNHAARDIARAVGAPLAGTLRSEPRIVRDLERGMAPASSGRGSLATLCRRLVGELRLTCGGVAA